MQECVFCQIAKGKIPAKIEYEDGDLIVFHDISPKAPVHLLIVPKKHLELSHDLDVEKMNLGRIFEVGKSVAKKLGVYDPGFKLVMNCGKGAGQAVDHIHIHLLGGWKFGQHHEMP